MRDFILRYFFNSIQNKYKYKQIYTINHITKDCRKSKHK